MKYATFGNRITARTATPSPTRSHRVVGLILSSDHGLTGRPSLLRTVSSAGTRAMSEARGLQ
jgi:hypothetical protein